MNEDLDDKLRKALRPVDPGEDFTARVVARAAAAGVDAGASESRKFARLVWLPAAAVACLVLVVAVTHLRHQHQEEAGQAARDQVMEALRVTSEKLDLAYEIVNNPAPAQSEDGSGA